MLRFMLRFLLRFAAFFAAKRSKKCCAKMFHAAEMGLVVQATSI